MFIVLVMSELPKGYLDSIAAASSILDWLFAILILVESLQRLRLKSDIVAVDRVIADSVRGGFHPRGRSGFRL